MIVLPLRSANEPIVGCTMNSFIPLSPPARITTSALATSIIATALSSADCAMSNWPAVRPSRWLRELLVSCSSSSMPWRAKIPCAIPTWSGSALAFGKALTRRWASSAARPAPETRARIATSMTTRQCFPTVPTRISPILAVAHATAIIHTKFSPHWPRCMAPAARGEDFMRAISLDEAMKLIAGTFEEAAKRRLRPLTAEVLDAGGHVKAALKQDRLALLRFEIAYGKAYAALSLGRSSRLVLQKSREKPIFMENLQALAQGPMFLEGGGQLVRDAQGEVVGAVGVTGDVNEMDDLAAVAGIQAAGFKSDYDFTDPADIHAMKIKEDEPPSPSKREAGPASHSRSVGSSPPGAGDRRTLTISLGATGRVAACSALRLPRGGATTARFERRRFEPRRSQESIHGRFHAATFTRHHGRRARARGLLGQHALALDAELGGRRSAASAADGRARRAAGAAEHRTGRYRRALGHRVVPPARGPGAHRGRGAQRLHPALSHQPRFGRRRHARP